MEKWRKEIEDAKAAGVATIYDDIDERSMFWLKAREGKDKETGELVIPDQRTLAVAQSIHELAQKKVKGEFVPRREQDELSLALGNKEHPDCGRGFSSKYGLKLGFPNQLAMYKTRQHYKDDLLAQLCKKADQYIDEKLNQWLQASQDQGSVEPSALVALCSVASTTHETSPVDVIDSPTLCALHIPYNWKGKTIKVVSGTAYPGCILHHSVLPEDYARVKVSRLFSNI